MIRPARPAARGRRRRAAIALGTAALTLGSLAIAAPANAEPESTFHEGYWHGIDVFVLKNSRAQGFVVSSKEGYYVKCTKVTPGWNRIELPEFTRNVRLSAKESCDYFSEIYDYPGLLGKPGQTWAISNNRAYVLRK